MHAKELKLQQIVEAGVSPALAAEILALQQAAFPETEAFRTRRWGNIRPAAGDLWFTARLDGRLIGSVLVLHRRIRTVAGHRVVGGIANVCSDPKARGLGAAKAVMQAAQGYFTQQRQVDYGMLICRDRVRDFYLKLGWRQIDNRIAMKDAHGRDVMLPEDRHTMIWPGRLSADTWPAGPVDLNGPRW